jgi:hypothetical protein
MSEKRQQYCKNYECDDDIFIISDYAVVFRNSDLMYKTLLPLIARTARWGASTHHGQESSCNSYMNIVLYCKT